MQAVILAGGLGTRLRPITETVPKPMVPVAGKPFLHHQLALLARQGFVEVLLLTGYLGEQIEAHFGRGAELGLSLRYQREERPLGTGGALRDALDQLDDRFIVLYGDSYLPFDNAAFADAFVAGNSLGMISVYRDPSGGTDVPGNVELGEGSLVRRYQKGAGLPLIEAGVLAFRKEVVARLPGGAPSSIEAELYPQLIAERQLRGYLTEQRFYDIGTPARLRQFEEHLA
jgi:NDP-sugar pyrophosphorylase family protein